MKTAKVRQLPDHLPIVSLRWQGTARQQELFAKLRLMLEADNVRIGRVRMGELSGAEMDLVRKLLDYDMLVADFGLAKASALLEFPESTEAIDSDKAGSRIVCSDEAELQSCGAQIEAWLQKCRAETPLTGAVLIGGRSSRMGRPKHLLQTAAGQSWLEHLLETVGPFASALAIAGKGELPDTLRQTRRVDDLPGLQGPLAGIGALFRDEPFSSQLILACDLPYMNSASVQWLLDQRQPRYVAVIPENPVTGRSEPLFGWYDYRCGPLIEDLIKSGSRRIREICASQLVLQPRIPAHLAGGWRNINRPEDL